MKVKVVKIQDRKYLALRWECPQTGVVKQKSARTNDQRKADRMASKLEEELRNGTYFEPCKMTWKEFRELFDELRLPNLRPATGVCYDSTFNRLEELANPFRLIQVNSILIARFQNKLRKIGNADTCLLYTSDAADE